MFTTLTGAYWYMLSVLLVMLGLQGLDTNPNPEFQSPQIHHASVPTHHIFILLNIRDLKICYFYNIGLRRQSRWRLCPDEEEKVQEAARTDRASQYRKPIADQICSNRWRARMENLCCKVPPRQQQHDPSKEILHTYPWLQTIDALLVESTEY